MLQELLDCRFLVDRDFTNRRGAYSHIVGVKVLVPVKGTILRSEFLLTFRLGVHSHHSFVAIVPRQAVIALLDDCNAVGLALGLILNPLD